MKSKKDSIHVKDFKYMEQAPYGDPDFSVEHNERVIKETNDWNDMMDRKRDRDFKSKIQERTTAVVQYLKSIGQGKASSVDSYFGKRHLAYLRGEEIVKQLKSNPELVAKLKNRYKQGEVKSL